MTDKKTLIAAAQVLGTKAFNEGCMAAPALDADMMALMTGLQVGEASPILKAWHRGWTLANLAA